MRQRLTVYTSVASKNVGVQRIKTPMKTPLLWVKYAKGCRIPVKMQKYSLLKYSEMGIIDKIL